MIAGRLKNPIYGERIRVEHRITGACGLASVLQRMTEVNRPILPNDLASVADALAFHLEQLANELDIDPDADLND